MTQADKDLLLKDMCARLPYGIKVQYENEIFDVEYVCPMYEEVKLDNHETWTLNIEEVKPYLFPMSKAIEEIVTTSNKHLAVNVDFFHKNHIDYRGLIDKGLAIDATNLNIY